MTGIPPFTPRTLPISTKNNFPILAQLGALAFVLVAIFSTLIFETDLNKNSNEAELASGYPQDTNSYPITGSIQMIENVSIEARAAYVWDVRGQRSLYNKAADKSLPLASITKLMTTLITYELLAPDEKISVPLSAVKQEGVSGLATGEKFDMKSLLQLALVSSSNDAAFTLADNVGSLLGNQDPTSQFIKGMNIRAEELGLNTLQFWNTTGLDLSLSEPGAVGSARDVSFLLEYIIENYPNLINDTQEETMRIYNTDGQYHDIENTNEVTLKIPNLIGSKTGYTDLAGGNLTVALDIGYDRPIIITVLGSTREKRFEDVLLLINAVQDSFATE